MVDRMMEQHKPVPAPFLTKTYQLVDDPSTDHIVSWGDDRLSTFVVWRPPEFARDVLPNYFKHNNFSSFVRQLNTYGFRKVVPERWEFANEYFRKGDKQLLCEIHRRKTPSSMPPSFSPSPPPFLPLYHPQPIHIPHHPPPPTTTTTTRLLELTASVAGGDANAAASALMEENERLRRHNAALMSELANMRKLYNDIIYFVQNHVQPVAPSSLMNQRTRMVMGLGLNANNNSSGSTTSSSSLTIVEEPLAVGNNNSSNGESSSRQLPKLFGVSLVSSSSGSKKRGLSLGDANDSSS